MKTLTTAFALFLMTSLSFGQTTEFSVQIDKDTVQMGEVFEVQFQLKNAQGSFEAPEMDGFTIVGGPNYASSYSMINGESSMSMSYSYYLKAEDEGEYFIGSATVEAEGSVFETEPLKIVVIYDPDYQKPERKPAIPQTSQKKKPIRI